MILTKTKITTSQQSIHFSPDRSGILFVEFTEQKDIAEGRTAVIAKSQSLASNF